MEFFDVIKNRHSICTFSDQPVEPEKLQQILEMANLAPSAGNLQAYEIYVVTDAKKRDGLSCAALAQEYVAVAPVALVFCTHPELTEWALHRTRHPPVHCAGCHHRLLLCNAGCNQPGVGQCVGGHLR